ncbi:sugar ABC transporter substrate-binding protein [Natronolimnobius sp. AArcel1]|uniref:ABC transporter substrate-binding protein n=1 Tax=Natronolimnobius sp. AArcel1 TaxID=1679093 RepID=UPI0013EC6014|nr:sugar ABC transporter substrate-binding protein [Natronolimnobius sp. AArcel1]NGM70504.1 sugar ABC transporter substrate-binding protein [Natronolimnobius sp. AArcel1]
MPTLRFVGRPFEGFERALERQMDSFIEQADQDVEFVRDHRPLPEIHEELVETGAIADGTYDLCLCLSDWLPALADAGHLHPLDEYITDTPPVDWPEGWADSMRGLVTYEGHVYGVPYHDGPELFHYREDLFESVAEQRAFRREYGRPLSVPRTWTEFLEVADFFTRPDEDLWGTVVAALPDGHNDVYDFLIQLWSRGGQVLDADGQPAFDDAAGHEALTFYHDLIHEHEVAPPESVELESVEAGQWYADGKAAMMWNWAGFGAMAESPDSAVFGHTNYGLIPRADTEAGLHTSLTVLYGLTIPAGSDYPDLAYDFIRHATTSEGDRITTLEGASGTRFSTWRDPEVLRANSFYSVLEEINTSAVNTLPQIPQYVELNDILDEMVAEAVVDRSETPDKALERAADRARALLE